MRGFWQKMATILRSEMDRLDFSKSNKLSLFWRSNCEFVTDVKSKKFNWSCPVCVIWFKSWLIQLTVSQSLIHSLMTDGNNSWRFLALILHALLRWASDKFKLCWNWTTESTIKPAKLSNWPSFYNSRDTLIRDPLERTDSSFHRRFSFGPTPFLCASLPRN